MSGYKFEIGQRVQVNGDGTGTVTYRCNAQHGATVYMVRPDGTDWEFLRGEGYLAPVPLVRGDVVRRAQADSIPVGTIVRDASKYKTVGSRSRIPGHWLRFGTDAQLSDLGLMWPVTVIEPAGDET